MYKSLDFFEDHWVFNNLSSGIENCNEIQSFSVTERTWDSVQVKFSRERGNSTWKNFFLEDGVKFLIIQSMATINTESMNCPTCHERMLYCIQGHSFCGKCSNQHNTCPICSSSMISERNLQLEKIISKLDTRKLKVDCKFADNGCKYTPSIDNSESHEKECKFREFQCEGKLFCNWKCNWTGHFHEIFEHFKTTHDIHSKWHFKYDCNIPINLNNNVKDLKIIDFSNGKQIFWCKHKIDTTKQKCYWVFQCIGTKQFATTYYYEFELYTEKLCKLKITDVCHSDSEDVETIFELEKCVCVSFQTILNYMENGNRLTFRFRIMKDKGPEIPEVSQKARKNRTTTESSITTHTGSDDPRPAFIKKPNNYFISNDKPKPPEKVKNRKYHLQE